ncbi:MAG TPA: PepSY domain-containing protein [Candidatus Binatia bacterium]
MKKTIGILVAGGALVLLVGAATAQWQGGYGPGRGGEMGYGMGYAMGGGPGMGRGFGPGNCPGWSQPASVEITLEKAKELAQHYADQYLPGYKVDRVLPFGGGGHTAYAVELKSADGELRTFHVNPFGNVMPFGGPWNRGS